MKNSLVEDDATRMAALGYQIGFDADGTDHQFVHVCRKYPGNALCETSLLWFHGETINAKNISEVDCRQCLALWQEEQS